jgi:phosphate transport system substrate-binding protein
MVEPSIESITAAADSRSNDMPADLRLSLVDSPGAAAYPISSFSYVLVYQDNSDRARAEALAKFLYWAIHDGQKLAPGLNYAPLPFSTVLKIEDALKSIKSGGAVVSVR